MGHTRLNVTTALFWWIGLFTSEGGMLRVVVVLVIIALLVGTLITSRRRP
jgi:hypothetical protein